MKLAKPALDIGLYTNQLDEMLQFWQVQPAVEFSEMLPVGGGVRQHRHQIGESILKINHARDPLPREPACGIQDLVLFDDGADQPQLITDPDGNRLQLLAKQSSSPNLRVVLHSADPDKLQKFYKQTLSLPTNAQGDVCVGHSQISFTQGAAQPGSQRALGYRYLTFQVYDVLSTHASLIADGAQEGMAPVKLGDVAYISFIRDPDGNWLEISQRKSLTGSLD